MAMLDTTAGPLLTAEQIAELVIQPISDQSTAYQVARVIPTNSPFMRVPVVTDDVNVAWTDEGDTITPGDMSTDEINSVPGKLAALTKVSNELAADSSPAATALVGESIARSCAREIDRAFFAEATAKGPSGLESLVGAGCQVVNAPLDSLDPFTTAISLISQTGSVPTAFCASATTVEELSKLRKFTGTGSASLEPLLAVDANSPVRKVVQGIPLWPLPDTIIPEATVWALARLKVLIIQRTDVTLAIDTSRYFDEDSVAVRTTLRIDFAFPHAASVVKIVGDGGS